MARAEYKLESKDFQSLKNLSCHILITSIKFYSLYNISEFVCTVKIATKTYNASKWIIDHHSTIQYHNHI